MFPSCPQTQHEKVTALHCCVAVTINPTAEACAGSAALSELQVVSVQQTSQQEAKTLALLLQRIPCKFPGTHVKQGEEK